MNNDETIPDWCIYRGETFSDKKNRPSENLLRLPEPPPWRRFDRQGKHDRGTSFEPEKREILRVNTALLLRRPLLITGRPGTGKTSLTYAVACELGMEPVLRWSITSRTMLQDGLYRYDAIGRLQETQRRESERREAEQRSQQGKAPEDDRELDIGNYLTLGPLGTAFCAREHRIADKDAGKEKTVFLPRVLLIDEIDKSDIDLPNDLLHLFEEGEFEIPELARLKRDKPFDIKAADHDDDSSFQYAKSVQVPSDGKIHCRAFPLVIMTSNGEREFPPAFLRRCLQLKMEPPDRDKLARIVQRHFQRNPHYQQHNPVTEKKINELIVAFENKRDGKTDGKQKDLATDQLLNAIYLVLENTDPDRKIDEETLLDTLWRPLSGYEGD
ncbi:MAG: MoxR family ATPase [Gammaproteobacteria bacterium]|nr:MoxR family ATPase [Gammaproteobacteria bacterium]